VDTVLVPLGTAEEGALEGEAGAGGAVGTELWEDEPPSPPEVLSRWAAREGLDFDERPSSLLEDVLPLVWRELRGVGIVIDREEMRICKGTLVYRLVRCPGQEHVLPPRPRALHV
jgi:hypothetical protein